MPVSMALEAHMFRFVRNLDRKVIFVVGFVSSFLLFATIILVQLADRDHEIARQKDTGLGATAGVDWSNPYSLWAHPRLVDAVFPLHRSARMYQAGVTLDPLQAPSSRRKIVRTGALWLAVNDPIHTIDEIAALAQRYNGYVVTEQNQTLAVTGEEGTL